MLFVFQCMIIAIKSFVVCLNEKKILVFVKHLGNSYQHSMRTEAKIDLD